MSANSLFLEAFKGMKRFGPGSDESTKRAISLYPADKQELKILDIGCGIGTHTLLLAEHFPAADITAIDVCEPHIEKLNQKAKANGMADRLHGITMSMFSMTFPDESFDLIWSEGAIYIAGFTSGLRDWRCLLKKGGYLICSEISWLKDNPSKESMDFWQEGYSQMNTIAEKLKQIEAAGYELAAHFVCPVSDWTENYYDPIEKNLKEMKANHPDDPDAEQIIQSLGAEIGLYRKHPDDYSYVFYIMKKTCEE